MSNLLVINGKEYIDLKNALEYIKVLDSENHMEKYNIKRFKQDISKIKYSLKKDIEKKHNCEHTILKNDDIYIDFNYFKKSIELCLKSIPVKVLVDKIIETSKMGDKLSSKNLIPKLDRSENLYCINLFSTQERFIGIDDFKRVLNEHEALLEKDCITIDELIDKINNIYHGFPRTKWLYMNIISEHNLEIFMNYRYNFIKPGTSLIPPETVDKVMSIYNDRVKKNIILINTSFDEYLSLQCSEFNEIYRELTDLEKEDFLIKKRDSIINAFKDTNIKCISLYSRVYVSKKEFEEFKKFKEEYVPAKVSFENERGIGFNASIAENLNIKLFKYKNTMYIRKSDMDIYANRVNSLNSYNKLESIYERAKFKIEEEPHWKNDMFPEVKELILEHCKNMKSKSKDSLSNYPSQQYSLYKTILNNIKVKLTNENELENDKLFTNILSMEGSDAAKRKIITFINFLKSKKGFKLKTYASVDDRKEKEKTPYSAESFINLLAALLEIVYDEEKLKKLYRNWNLSSSILYVFLHYSIAWRRKDMLDKIPVIDLRLINPSIKDGEMFIEWLEKGNTISPENCMEVCKSIEEQTKRLRLKANKNKERLHCVICDALIEPIGILLYINQANRQIHLKQLEGKRHRVNYGSLNERYTRSTYVKDQLETHFKIDITKILGGSFDNTRMNKGFLSLVQDKSQELNLFGYYYAQVLRSHRFNRNALSETTKIYLDKSVEKNIVKVFATGTMGSVAYILNQLVDKEFDKKTIDEQISIVNETNITPYAAEQSIKVISNKISKMDAELNKYFAKGGSKEGFLSKVLYGDDYGLEERTKCLVKITNEKNCITRIAPFYEGRDEKVIKNCPIGRRTCVGCDYVITLRYFIYTFEQRFNQVLTKLENAKSKYDKEIIIDIINTSYVPLMNDLGTVLGPDEVYKAIDTVRYGKLVQMYQEG